MLSVQEKKIITGRVKCIVDCLDCFVCEIRSILEPFGIILILQVCTLYHHTIQSLKNLMNFLPIRDVENSKVIFNAAALVME